MPGRPAGCGAGGSARPARQLLSRQVCHCHSHQTGCPTCWTCQPAGVQYLCTLMCSFLNGCITAWQVLPAGCAAWRRQRQTAVDPRQPGRPPAGFILRHARSGVLAPHLRKVRTSVLSAFLRWESGRPWCFRPHLCRLGTEGPKMTRSTRPWEESGRLGNVAAPMMLAGSGTGCRRARRAACRWRPRQPGTRCARWRTRTPWSASWRTNSLPPRSSSVVLRCATCFC